MKVYESKATHKHRRRPGWNTQFSSDFTPLFEAFPPLWVLQTGLLLPSSSSSSKLLGFVSLYDKTSSAVVFGETKQVVSYLVSVHFHFEFIIFFY